MLTLGIETSGRLGSVALVEDGTLLAARSLESKGRRHAQALVAEAKSLFDERGRRLARCDLVAVSIGPGSFTGLRVGVVFAKTLAYAAGCRLAAVDTFQAVAADSPDDVDALHVVADAQRGDIYTARYVRDPGGVFRRAESIVIAEAETWCRQRLPGDVVSGPDRERCAALLSPGWRLMTAERRAQRAETVARLGAKQAEEGRTDDPWTLEPLYLRKSAAEEKWESTFDGGDGSGRL